MAHFILEHITAFIYIAGFFAISGLIVLAWYSHRRDVFEMNWEEYKNFEVFSGTNTYKIVNRLSIIGYFLGAILLVSGSFMFIKTWNGMTGEYIALFIFWQNVRLLVIGGIVYFASLAVQNILLWIPKYRRKKAIQQMGKTNRKVIRDFPWISGFHFRP